jgi:SPP1 gp7 family putative phage head morphogenesis protein
VEARAHATAFTVAGILRQDILQDVRAGLQDSLDNGLTLEQFRRQMTQKLTQKGWLADKAKLVADEDGVLEGKQLTPRRLRTIFETNMQSSYGAGRYAQQMENAADRPYWTRVAVMDLRTRPAHAALNGLTARYDDPIWQFAYPPDGWGCRCRVRARSQSDIDSKASPSGRARASGNRAAGMGAAGYPRGAGVPLQRSALYPGCRLWPQSGSGLAGGSRSTPDGPLNHSTTTDGRAGCSAHTFGAAAA